MKVYIKDSRLIIGRDEIPSAHYRIRWNQLVGENPTAFQLVSMGTGMLLPLSTEEYYKVVDCETEAGVPYNNYSDFIAAIGSFFVRALTVAEGELDTRLINLESNDTIYQVYSSTGTTQTGTITIPAEAVLYDLYNDGLVDQIVVKSSPEGSPLDEVVKTSGGQTVTVTSLDASGNYVLSGIPITPACIVYFIAIQDKHKSNVPLSSIVDHIDIDFITRFNAVDDTLATLTGNGVVSGMGLSVNGDNTKFSVAPGIYHKHLEGNITYLGQSNITPAYLTTGNATYIALNTSTNILLQQATHITREQRRTHVLLGTIVHSNKTTINAVNSTPDVALSFLAQFNDLLDVFNIINVGGGNIFTPNGTNLSVNKSIGEHLKKGTNFDINTLDPLVKLNPALVAPQMRDRLSTGAESADSIFIPKFWESSVGVRTAIPNTDYAIHRVWVFPSNIVRIQLGATLYNSITLAKQQLFNDIVATEANLKENGLLRAFIIIRGNATNLGNPAEAYFSNASMFGEVNAGGTGGTTTLDQAYLNSLIPQISITDAQGALTAKSTRSLASSKVLEILNSIDQSVFNITAEGRLQIGDIVGGNYAEFEPDGTLRSNGNGATWEDIDFPIIIRTTGTNVPLLTTLNGNLTMPQWAVNDFAMSESQEFIHKWKEGSACYWHIHLNTNGLDATNRYVKFSLEYGYTDGNSLWTFPSVFTTPDILIPANTPSKTQIIMPITNFTPTGSRIAGHVVARLTRVASTGVAPTNNPWIPMLQMHVLCDTNGSREMTTK